MISRITVLFILLMFFITPEVLSQRFTVSSPDGMTVVTVEVGERIKWKAERSGEIILENNLIDLQIGGENLGQNARVRRNRINEVNERSPVVVPTKNDSLHNHYRELSILFRNKWELQFRAYNDGIAYRLLTHMREDITIDEEVMHLSFPDGTTSLFPLEESTYSHNERNYIPTMLDTLSSNEFASLPVYFSTPGGFQVLFSEADVFNYPQMFLRGGDVLHAMHPPVVAETIPEEGPGADRNVVIVREESYIAELPGETSLPWRFMLISREEKDFLDQNMVLRLSRGVELDDTSWISPGKVAWDWYNANNIWNVDFASGLNTETYKYYIDFASEYGIEYVILDEGWTKSTLEILDFNPDIDVPELIKYGKEKNVGIILWCLWKPLDQNMDEILDTYANWGAKGIKVDFMQRSDQYMTQSYENIARACSKRKLLVDFHGAFKPGGLRSAYPNIISYEGVKGNEHQKWSHDITPRHNTTLPFTRMAVGPMDYTPGAMRNYHLEDHPINFTLPASIGTRSHQVALYTIFESPLQMLCDSPSEYLEDKETTEFITQIPTTWDETVPLQGKVGEYVAVARRKGETWYVGAITNEDPRNLILDLGFLGAGSFRATVYRDGINTARFAEDHVIEQTEINGREEISINMAPGGGWSCKIQPAN
jgi:alpha-glucosidase